MALYVAAVWSLNLKREVVTLPESSATDRGNRGHGVLAPCDVSPQIGQPAPDLGHRSAGGVHPYRGADLATCSLTVGQNVGHCLEPGVAVPLHIAPCCRCSHYPMVPGSHLERLRPRTLGFPTNAATVVDAVASALRDGRGPPTTQAWLVTHSA
jgi:hypothetical protein